MTNTVREQVERRWKALEQDRSSWVTHWKEISGVLLPRSGRFLQDQKSRGDKRHNLIIDSTGTRALRTLAAGIMAGMTSPARPWFRLASSIPDLDESAAVKLWLAENTRLMQMVFAKSNTYRALHTGYEELGAFGTWSNILMPHYHSVIHSHPLTIGEFAIATDYYGAADTIYREFELSVANVIAQFGIDSVSPTVKGLYQSGAYDKTVRILHAIEPRRDRDTSKRDNKNMPFRSVYIEQGADNVLRESGYREFPALCPRWSVAGGDAYGGSPGMESLGDIKQLQHEQLKKGKAIDYQADPPLQIPTQLKNSPIDTLPGGITFVDASAQTGGIRSAFEVNLRLDYLLEDIRDVRERINGNFYADLFLMLANGANKQMTATEVAERHEEKLLMLGPVLERLHNEILEPLISRTFAMMVEAGIVPPAPKELQGKELTVEFVSMLAQAQRAVATNSVDRFVGNLGAVAGIKPEVLDKFDADRWADEYADMLGVNPELIVPGDRVALVRKQRAEQIQAQQQAEQATLQAEAAAKLASADTSKQNALTDITRNFSGYT